MVGERHLLEVAKPLLIANHESVLDAVLIAVFLPRELTVAVSHQDMRHPLVRWLIRRLRHVVIEPARPLEVRHLVRTVQRGEPVAIFPEGAASATGALGKVYDAAGVIAARCDADIVPVAIQGALYSRFSRVGGNFPKRWRPSVTLTVLPATRLPAIPPLKGRERRRRLGDEVLRIMQRMLVEARPRTTLFEAFLGAVEIHGRTTCILEDARGARECYGDLLRTSLALGRLVSRLTAEREIVGVLMPNLGTTVALVLGLSALGRVPAMINFTAGAEAIAAACAAARIRTVLTSRTFLERARLADALRALAGIQVVALEDLLASLTLVDKLWLVGYALWRPRTVLRGSDPADCALVLFTSGSEARPKAVLLTHEAILAGIAQLRAVIDFGPDDKYLNALPLYHTYGLIACTLMPLLTGTRLRLHLSPLHYRQIPDLAYTSGCTYLFGTGTFLAHYARHAHPYDFHRVRAVICGGEKLDPEVAELWANKFGLRVLEGYGATECGPAMALNTPLAYRKGTVGRFLPGIEYRLLPVPGIERGGALHVRGPNLMRGYYFHEAPGVLHAPRSALGPGWYDTGDVVEVDEEGFVTVLGRVKRFAKVAGEMVSLELVERIAAIASPTCFHAATVESAAGGESTVLFTTDPTLDRIRLHQAARTIGAQELAVARRIVHVAELPLLASGKTDYVRLKAMAEACPADPLLS